MKRTIIVTIETSGEEDGRILEKVEDEFLDNTEGLGRRYGDRCFVQIDITVEPLAQTLIDKLCNPKPAGETE